jgi:ribosomal-protein-alanine N-acetyltransferase
MLPLSSPRVVLRLPTPADREEYVRLRVENRAHLEPWEPILSAGGAFTSAEFDRVLAQCEAPDCRRLLVVFRDGAIIGRVSLTSIVRGPLQQAYIGYWIGRAHEGKGLMIESVRLALGFAFAPESIGGLGLHRVECNMMPANAPSEPSQKARAVA